MTKLERDSITKSRTLKYIENTSINSSPTQRFQMIVQSPLIKSAGRRLSRVRQWLLNSSVLPRLKGETDERQNTLITGLRSVIAVTDELMAAPDAETLYRRAVELAREKLDVERCSIFLEDDDNLMRGTYGTDMEGNTTDEHAATIPKSDGLLDRFLKLAPQEQQWLVRDRKQSYWKGGHIHNVGTGWNAISRIHSANRGIGVFFNDAAISHIPLDTTKQEVIAIFCSMLGKIIERKRMEQTLRQSEERYRRLFDQIDDTVLIHDLEGNILDVNEAACHLLGYTRDELLHMRTVEIDGQDFADDFKQRLHQQLNDGKLSNIQGTHITRDGRQVDIGVNATVITYKEQPAVLAVCRDITEQKRIERDLRDLNQLKTEFLSTAAHELRTPLASLVGFSELLLTRDIDADRTKHFMQIIHEQSVNLRRIIDSLLDISRLESKQGMALNVQRFNMAELITQTQAYFSEVLPKYRVQIDGSPAYPAIMGDPFRLGQVLQNLLSNAIKYSPKGGTITVRTQLIPNYLQVSVQDQGIGMTAQQQAHLFERFYRADASNTTISGTGLGLAICKLIIELHGGQIWAESEYGIGTTVYFTLPLMIAPVLMCSQT
ncbi:MAG: sensor histidine kinase [Aggregatilineales bacterium]